MYAGKGMFHVPERDVRDSRIKEDRVLIAQTPSRTGIMISIEV
jgi:hypothetical protein